MTLRLVTTSSPPAANQSCSEPPPWGRRSSIGIPVVPSTGRSPAPPPLRGCPSFKAEMRQTRCETIEVLTDEWPLPDRQHDLERNWAQHAILSRPWRQSLVTTSVCRSGISAGQRMITFHELVRCLDSGLGLTSPRLGSDQRCGLDHPARNSPNSKRSSTPSSDTELTYQENEQEIVRAGRVSGGDSALNGCDVRGNLVFSRCPFARFDP